MPHEGNGVFDESSAKRPARLARSHTCSRQNVTMTEDKMIRLTDSENRDTFSKGSNIVDSKEPQGFQPPPVASLVVRPPANTEKTPNSAQDGATESQG